MKESTIRRIADALEHLALKQDAISEEHLDDCPACSVLRRRLNLTKKKFKAVRHDDKQLAALVREVNQRRALLAAEPQPEAPETTADSFRYRERNRFAE